jgi:acetylornithine deacetylase/succinyl-diaminopimelate desuccinylase-like protein
VGKQARTIIPAEVTIEIDMRLVQETEGLRQVNLVKQYIIDQGFHMVDVLPTDAERAQFDKLASFTYILGSVPFRTDYSSPLGVWLSAAVTRATGQVPLKLRTTGGSQPIAPFVKTLNVPAISVRIPNPGSNIHAANENIRIGNFLEGIETCLSILTQPIQDR